MEEQTAFRGIRIADRLMAGVPCVLLVVDGSPGRKRVKRVGFGSDGRAGELGVLRSGAQLGLMVGGARGGVFWRGRAAKFLPSATPLRRSFIPISNTVFLKQDVVTPTGRFRIAERLGQARRSVAPALSQATLAKQVQVAGLKDCSGSRLSRLEAGYADAQWREIEVLANVLKVSPQWLAAVDELPAAAPLALSALPPPVVAAPPAVTCPATPTQANGTHPDFAAFKRGAHRSDYEFRQHLAATLDRARTKLHEAGLPAPDWKHWRMVERRAMDELRKSS